MSFLHKRIILPALSFATKNDAESAHEFALWALTRIGHEPLREIVARMSAAPSHERTVFGITFPNPVGLAAGFDKNGVAIRGTAAIGFGFTEIGTVTPNAQVGKERPRMFRLSKEEGLINRMGFNNNGVTALISQLHRHEPYGFPVGISIGRGVDTANADAIADYLYCIEGLYPYASYFVCNVSSPNTPGLRQLQAQREFAALLSSIQQRLRQIARSTEREKIPLLAKVSPDLTVSEFCGALQAITDTGTEGIIIGNTTTDRTDCVSAHKNQIGGMSGPLLYDRMIARVGTAKSERPDLPVIAVGGINSVDRAQRAFNFGADLIQLYTGLVYEGFILPSRIAQGLRIEK
jgi:dihydroorotate dehydrogenase